MADETGLSRDAQALLEAVAAMSSDLELPNVLQRIVVSACELTGARYGALGVLNEQEELGEFITHGLDEAARAAIGDLPRGRGILGLLIKHPEPLRLERLQSHHESFGFPANHPPMTTFLGVPLRVRGAVFGNLYLTEKDGGEPFTAQDEQLVEALASAAGVVIQSARAHELAERQRAQARADREQLALVTDRDRIARDLHDLVIQRLFATGLQLQGVRGHVVSPVVADRIDNAVADLDATIRDIRSTIFALQQPRHDSLRAQVTALVDEYAGVLGFAPEVRVTGPVDTAVPREVADHLLAVLREALSNVARHAQARTVHVEVHADAADARLRVADDGIGLAEPRGESGLANVRRRADELGGRLAVGPGAGPATRPGTVLEWRAPLAT